MLAVKFLSFANPWMMNAIPSRCNNILECLIGYLFSCVVFTDVSVRIHIYNGFMTGLHRSKFKALDPWRSLSKRGGRDPLVEFPTALILVSRTLYISIRARLIMDYDTNCSMLQDKNICAAKSLHAWSRRTHKKVSRFQKWSKLRLRLHHDEIAFLESSKDPQDSCGSQFHEFCDRGVCDDES